MHKLHKLDLFFYKIINFNILLYIHIKFGPNKDRLLLMHLAIYYMHILLKASNITFFKSISSSFNIASSLLFLIYCLPILITSSIPLYYGEYTGVYAYLKLSSSILSMISLLLCSDKLSITRSISSNGYFYLNSSRKILNFSLFIDLSYT